MSTSGVGLDSLSKGAAIGQGTILLEYFDLSVARNRKEGGKGRRE